MKFIRLLIFFLCFHGVVNAQWTQVYQAPGNQDITVLSAPNDQVCWFVTTMDSLYKTTDGGTTWARVPVPPAFVASGLYAMNADTAFKAGGGTLYRTVNGGLNWNVVFAAATGIVPDVWMRDNLTGVMMYNYSLFLTTDGGATWSSTGINQPPLSVQNSVGRGAIWGIGDTLFVSQSNSGIAYSYDFGQTWTKPANTGINLGGPSRICFGSSQLGLATRNTYPFIYATTNGGASWTIADNSLGSNQDVVVREGRCWYIPNPADHFYIKYSADSGKTWVQQLTDPFGFDVLTKARVGSTLWAATTKGKVFLYHDITTGIADIQPFSVKVAADASGFHLLNCQFVGNVSCVVGDATGKVVGVYALSTPTESFGGELPTGIYMIRVEQGRESFNLRVLKP